jgi:threonine dehydrogenase-like Zn-dependent dehydrogenase
VRGAVMYAPGDVRVEDVNEPQILNPTDAIIRLSASCICGSDLWAYRGIESLDGPRPMGHEYAGIVDEVGSAVSSVKAGQFVVGSFFASDNTCEICRSGYQPSCPNSEAFGPTGAAQAERMRVPLADGTLVATPEVPAEELVPHFLATSDVLGTGWLAAVAAEVGPGKTVVVVGDGAVGLLGVLAASELGAERVIAISRNEPRQQLALEFGATDIVTERGEEGVAAIKDLTDGLGAHSAIEAVGTQESMMQAIHSTRAGGHAGFVGVTHEVALRAWSCSSPTCICTAVRPRSVGSCLTSWTGFGRARSSRARCSTWSCRSTMPPTGTRPWTNAAPSRSFSARD